VSFGEGAADFNDLTVALLGAKVDRGADSCGAHVVSLPDGAEENLVELVGEGEQFVVIDLYDEGNPVRVLAGHRAEDPERGGNRIATALDGQLDDVFSVEVIGILGEASAAGVFDALVDGQDREVAGAGEAAVVKQAMKIVENAKIPVRGGIDAIDEVGPGNVQALL